MKRLVTRSSHKRSPCFLKVRAELATLYHVTRMDDDALTSGVVFARGHTDCSPHEVDIAVRFYVRFPTMTQPSALRASTPSGACHPTEEDRATHRRWARRSYIAYSVVVIAMLTVSLWSRDPRDSRVAKESRTAGVGTMAQPPMAPLTVGSQKRNSF
jgi:hypothetical protein